MCLGIKNVRVFALHFPYCSCTILWFIGQSLCQAPVSLAVDVGRKHLAIKMNLRKAYCSSLHKTKQARLAARLELHERLLHGQKHRHIILSSTHKCSETATVH